MGTDYDSISEQYQRSKLTPWRTHIEAHTLLQLIGDVSGKNVLDLACGEGFYARLLKLLGAGSVTGIDLSEGMIELALKQEEEHPLGISYRQGDARELAEEANFDLVASAYLLNYATTRDELSHMVSGIASALKPGGRFVTVNSHPGLDFRSAPSYRHYGFETRAHDPWQEGSPITWTFFLEDTEFSIENYHLSIATHEQAFREAGFREIIWHTPCVSPEGISEFGEGYWETFLRTPPATFIECRL
jgi:ubiquinone/menaquinone biosynthesis C-methylase UbiE